MSNPTLSIIIPVYNTSLWLKGCLDSILAQEFTDFEVIAINDGSKDDSLSILRTYEDKDSRIKVIDTPNRGVSAARNIGLASASGTFITFVDSDDTILPSYLSNFSYDQTYDYEIQGFEMVYLNNKANNRKIHPQLTGKKSMRKIIEETELKRLSRGPVIKLFKSSIIREYKILFNEELSYGEDVVFVKEYLCHCSNEGRTICASDYQYIHRDNPQSLTTRRHDYRALLKATELECLLFSELESKFGQFSNGLSNFFNKERALETYASFRELIYNKRDKFEKIQDIDLVRNLINSIPNTFTLPPIYKLLDFTLKHFSNPACYYINSMIVRTTDFLHHR